MISRRKFISSTAVAGVALSSIPLFSIGCSDSKKPNSKVKGVQLGCTTYSYGRMEDKSIPAVIEYLTYAGINSIELRSIAEEALGIPSMDMRAFYGGGGGGRVEMTDEQRAELQKQREELVAKQREWRLSLPMSKYTDMRKQFDDAGIEVHIAKFAPSTWSDEEIDYAYKAAQILGAYGITDELSEAACMRLGKFAEKHNSLAIFHTHAQFAQPGFDIEKYFAMSPANRLNLDIGHYYGETGKHPGDLVAKYHDKIPSIHVKDKTAPKDGKSGVNKPFGEGETPIADVLLMLKEEKWPINVDIELEYPIPEGSDAMKEVAKCIEYMRNILE